MLKSDLTVIRITLVHLRVEALKHLSPEYRVVTTQLPELLYSQKLTKQDSGSLRSILHGVFLFCTGSLIQCNSNAVMQFIPLNCKSDPVYSPVRLPSLPRPSPGTCI